MQVEAGLPWHHMQQPQPCPVVRIALQAHATAQPVSALSPPSSCDSVLAPQAAAPSPGHESASLSVQVSLLQAELCSSQAQVSELRQRLAAAEAGRAGLQEQLEHLGVKVGGLGDGVLEGGGSRGAWRA